MLSAWQALNRLLPYHVDDLGDVMTALKKQLGTARKAPFVLCWLQVLLKWPWTVGLIWHRTGA